MEITTGIGGATVRRRLSAALVALALVAGTVLLIQQQAAEAQIGGIGDLFQSIVCPILLAVRNAFADGPFGDFVTTLLNQFLVAFGCAPSG